MIQFKHVQKPRTYLGLLIASHFSQSLHRLDSPHQEMKYPPIPYDQLAVGQILGSSLSMQWNTHTQKNTD
jgi:hypothetical protein